jgi:hypothetical protein
MIESSNLNFNQKEEENIKSIDDKQHISELWAINRINELEAISNKQHINYDEEYVVQGPKCVRVLSCRRPEGHWILPCSSLW